LISILALLSNYDRENCLINLGTEGSDEDQSRDAGVTSLRRETPMLVSAAEALVLSDA
jgi:hypothetical protein